MMYYSPIWIYILVSCFNHLSLFPIWCLGWAIEFGCISSWSLSYNFYTLYIYKSVQFFGLVWFLYTALQHILGHFERGQLP